MWHELLIVLITMIGICAIGGTIFALGSICIFRILSLLFPLRFDFDDLSSSRVSEGLCLGCYCSAAICAIIYIFTSHLR